MASLRRKGRSQRKGYWKDGEGKIEKARMMSVKETKGLEGCMQEGEKERK